MAHVVEETEILGHQKHQIETGDLKELCKKQTKIFSRGKQYFPLLRSFIWLTFYFQSFNTWNSGLGDGSGSCIFLEFVFS